MAADRIVLVLALTLISACNRNDDVSLREIALDDPVALAAAKIMYRDNPDTVTHREWIVKAYYIEAKFNNCVWFVYDARVGFNDSEFVYCSGKNDSRFRRL